jgi:hypothetical protein
MPTADTADSQGSAKVSAPISRHCTLIKNNKRDSLEVLVARTPADLAESALLYDAILSVSYRADNSGSGEHIGNELTTECTPR